MRNLLNISLSTVDIYTNTADTCKHEITPIAIYPFLTEKLKNSGMVVLVHGLDYIVVLTLEQIHVFVY